MNQQKLNNIKFFVRTTGERKFDYDIEFELLVDKRHDPVGSFIRQLKIISGWDAVLLEDDLVLCKDFKEIIENIINDYPNSVINFFTMPNIYFSTHFDCRFSSNQCTYYPRGIALKIALEMEEVRKILPNAQYDILQRTAMERLGLVHLIYRPCLVQHLDNDSFINNAIGLRRSIYFKDYLDYLDIEYEDAFTYENKKKLTELMNSMEYFKR